MGWILAVILGFVGIVVLNGRRGDGEKTRKAMSQAVLVGPASSLSAEGFRGTVAKKGLLMALFMLVSPRKARKRSLPSPEEPCLMEREELMEFLGEAKTHAGNPLHYPLIYADAYRDASQTPADVWENFLQGVFIYTRRHNAAQALPLLQRVVNSGFLPACAILGDLYAEYGDTERAIATVLPASEANYAPAVHQHAYYVYLESLGKLFQYRRVATYRTLFIHSARLGYPPSRHIVTANGWE